MAAYRIFFTMDAPADIQQAFATIEADNVESNDEFVDFIRPGRSGGRKTAVRLRAKFINGIIMES